jgi:hypothetical protein
MHKSQNLFNLTTAVHVSGVTITHLQEHKQLYLQHQVTVTPYCCLLLSWKRWNRFECVVGGVRHRRYSCFALLKMGDNKTRNM